MRNLILEKQQKILNFNQLRINNNPTRHYINQNNDSKKNLNKKKT
jgi:hypothetical protein